MSQVPDEPPGAAARQQLVDTGRRAAQGAYSPYSSFRVGAAVLAAQDIYAGCNIENASYGLTVCAERVAIFNAISAGHRQIQVVFVTCPDATADGPQTHRMPCGACRQVMAEFGGPDLLVIVDQVGEFQLRDLLPEPFGL